MECDRAHQALSAGLAWPCGIAAAGLIGIAVADLIGGQTIGADEAQHLITAVGAALLFWQARHGEPEERRGAGRGPRPARDSDRGQAVACRPGWSGFPGYGKTCRPWVPGRWRKEARR